MVFNSVVFLFCFLPLALLAYYLVPGRGKNVVLLVESLLFYCWTGVEYLPLIVCLIVFNYLWGLLTARTKAKLKGLLPAVAVLVNLAALVYFKYANFLIDTLNRIGNFGLAALDVGAVLPLGISYYIFKIISYEADVYTGKVEAEKDPIALAAYVLFFPQLIVGPIIKYRDMAPQLHNYKNRCNAALMERGVELFLFGLAKKVILADSIGALWTDIISTGGVGLSNVSTPLAWLGIIAYSLQLYFDFAGYSEMSNGLAALMGFDCAANFDLPYISASITEFWRRWHISLSGWFRDYIYIPLGGNRKGAARQMLNMFLVWAATGIWHGASWNFIVWGLYYFVLLVIEKNFLLKFLKKCPLAAHIYTLFFVVLGWGIFTANQPGAPLGLLLNKLFVPQGGISPVYYLRNYGVFLVLGCVCSFGAAPLAVGAHQPQYGGKSGGLGSAGAAVHCLCSGRHQHDGPVRQFLKGGTGSWEKLYTAKKQKSRSPYPLLILGAAVVFGFSLVNLVFPKRDQLELENRKAAQLPAFSVSALLDGSWQSGFARWMQDQFALRDVWVNTQRAADEIVFQKVEEGGILLGKDHWMFTEALYRGRCHPEAAC